jgi:anti-sigma regulatory factor (Ser/Thr protein kinase)
MKMVLHHECPSCPSQMSGVRARIRESAKAFGFPDDVVNELVLAVDEACTNIIRYAYEGKTEGKIEIDVCEDCDLWEVRLKDYGKKCKPADLQGRDLEQVRPGGLGLFFIQRAFDQVRFDFTQKVGTVLILRKHKPQNKS